MCYAYIQSVVFVCKAVGLINLLSKGTEKPCNRLFILGYTFYPVKGFSRIRVLLAHLEGSPFSLRYSGA